MGTVDEEAGLPSTTRSKAHLPCPGDPTLSPVFILLLGCPCLASASLFLPSLHICLSTLSVCFLGPSQISFYRPCLSQCVGGCPLWLFLFHLSLFFCLCFCRLSALSDPFVSNSIPLDPPALPQWRNATLLSLTSSMSRTRNYTIFRRRLKR